MSELSLPQNFEGYSTAELVKLWDGIPRWWPGAPEVPPEKVGAMRHLLRQYRLASNNWSQDKEERKADMAQAKKLLEPFGIDPAPWADSEGNRLPEAEDKQAAST